MRGFWRRPITRTYEYNLEVGEHYYSPLTSYLETRQGGRGETPGALTYSERLARKWIYGRRYDSDELKERYTRSASVARGEGFAASASNLETSLANRSSRAVSEARILASSSLQSRAENSSSISQQRQNLLSASRSSLSHTAQTTSSRQETKYESKKSVRDDVSKQIADVRFTSLGVSDVQDAAARARARIFELERELEEISRQAMASQNRALKTAREMAFQASVEDEAIVAASSAKSRKLIMETRGKF